jgi:putative transposase
MSGEFFGSFRGSATECKIEALPQNKAKANMGRSRYKTIKNCKIYFASCTVIEWLPLFASPKIAEIVLDSIRFMHDNQRIILHAYVLMETHLHLIGSSDEFSGEMRKFKSFTARSIVDLLKEEGPRVMLDQLKFHKRKHKIDQAYQVWQEGFHPKMILNEEMLNKKIEYIHHNPVKLSRITINSGDLA